ncbi:MAG: peptidoglycan-associated lipoprotein Pal [Acidobacteria bacterium]|nr:peptidoglycan-associated lipoprotein Pal [Acidobacteriota bacterium]
MRFWKISTIPTIVLLMAIPLFLSGCPKRPDLPAGGATQPSAGQVAGAPSATPGLTTSPAAPSSSSYSSSVRTQEEKVTPPGAIQESPAQGAPSAGPTGAAGKGESPLKDIFFDFDKSNIRDDAKPNLAEDTQWLKANPTAKITIEGHCDERGTAEYNLGLGERRAKASSDYLVAAGIDAKRIKIISFGKERPFVLGHDESAWKWNRRAHFVVSEK